MDQSGIEVLIDFIELHPNLAKGYNNSARGRAESARLWQEVAAVLNAEGSGTYKLPQGWSTYLSNYKSRLKHAVASLNSDASGTGGGPPRGSSLSDIDNRFLAIMGPGFGQTAPSVHVNPFPDLEQQQPLDEQQQQQQAESSEHVDIEEVVLLNIDEGSSVEQPVAEPSHQVEEIDSPQPQVEVSQQSLPGASAPPLPRRARQPRYRTRPLAPLDEARRILSQVELQRASADAASARALELIGQNLGRLADAVEQFVNSSIVNSNN